MQMSMHNVPSSNVDAVGYDTGSQTLQVRFLSGAVYQYYGVSEGLYDQFMQAPSKGQFLHAYIKNQYAYSRVG